MYTLLDTVPATVTLPPELASRLQRVRIGAYQRDALTNRQRWSGADLKGKAKKWGGKYARARKSAFNKLVSALDGSGFSVAVVRGVTGGPKTLGIVWVW